VSVFEETEQLGDRGDHVGESSWPDTSTSVQLSVITDEIDARLRPALDICEELGIRAVELRTVDAVSIVDHTPEVLRAIRQELNGRGFRVCAIASPFLKCDRGDDPLVQERVHERALEAAAVMSAPIVRAFAYWRESDPSAALPELGSALSRAAARASDVGVTLALENEHECNVATSVEARAALDAAASPDLRLIWDPGNAAMLDPPSFTGLGGLETIYDRVAHVHLKDVSASGSWTRVGDGIVAFAALLRYLAGAGYDGYLSFETHYHRDGSGELATRDCVAALRSIAAQADVELAV
jgi:L-ribulose-5-phosphate 3-epimerase